MKVIIIPDDKAVYVDGEHVHVKNFEDLGIAPNVHAVHWDSGLKRGEVQYKTPAPTVLDEVAFNAMFVHVVAHHDNVSMDLEATRLRREMEDKAHTERINALNDARAVREESTANKLTKALSDIAALQAQVVKMGSAQ